MHTPTTLADLKNEDLVFPVKQGNAETFARKFFASYFEDVDSLQIRHLFFEPDEDGTIGEGYQVWEAFNDAGSVDRLYMIERIK